MEKPDMRTLCFEKWEFVDKMPQKSTRPNIPARNINRVKTMKVTKIQSFSLESNGEIRLNCENQTVILATDSFEAIFDALIPARKRQQREANFQPTDETKVGKTIPVNH